MSFKIDVSTIDNFIQENNIGNAVPLLKIDVEGYEIEVLKEARKSSSRGIIDAVQIKSTQINSTSKVFMKDFFNILEENLIFVECCPLRVFY